MGLHPRINVVAICIVNNFERYACVMTLFDLVPSKTH